MNKAFYYYMVCVAVLSGCAQQRGLSGGEKDVEPPTVLATYPIPGTTRFSGKSFTIEFDEYVQLNGITQELIVSPPLLKQPKVKIKHKSIIVKWEEELLSNTTYVFNFGNGIADVNEKNIAEDLSYVFSTGDAIDSLQITGKVWNSFLDEPGKAIKVLAFLQDSSLVSKKPQPAYFARTKEDGSFKLSYMRANSYYLFALEDINGNYRYDAGEAIAFLDSPLTLDTTARDSLSFQLSTPRFENPLVNDYDTDSTGTLSFSWDPFYSQPNIKSTGALSFVSSTNISRDTIMLHFEGRPTDRYESMVIQWQDVFSDTITIPFFEKALNAPFSIGHEIAKRIRKDQKLILKAKGDIKLRNSAAVQLLEDSVSIPASIGVIANGFEIIAKRREGKKYQLTIWPEALSNAIGQTNDTLIVQFTTLKPEELGELIMELKFNPSFDKNLFRLFDKSGAEVFRAINIQSGDLSIPNLTPGEYTASFLADRNGNGLYDPAIFQNKLQPERIYKHVEKMNVRSNWQLRQRWEIVD